MKNKLKLFGVSMALSLCLVSLIEYGPAMLSAWADDPVVLYCKKAKECMYPSLELSECKEKVEMIIKYGRTSEENFLECSSCVNSHPCSALHQGTCSEQCQ